MQQDLHNNPFWRFCVEYYQRPACQKVLLQLQDNFDLNVNMLLFMVYLQEKGIAITADELDRLKRQNQPLLQLIYRQREKRRAVKASGTAAYERAKKQELELESQHIQTLYQKFCGYLPESLEQQRSIDNIGLYINYEMGRDASTSLQKLAMSLRLSFK